MDELTAEIIRNLKADVFRMEGEMKRKDSLLLLAKEGNLIVVNALKFFKDDEVAKQALEAYEAVKTRAKNL